MKNKKKQFEALKNKLKNLYFKGSISVSRKNSPFHLLLEKEKDIFQLNPVEKIKTKETIWIKENKSLPDAAMVATKKSKLQLETKPQTLKNIDTEAKEKNKTFFIHTKENAANSPAKISTVQIDKITNNYTTKLDTRREIQNKTYTKYKNTNTSSNRNFTEIKNNIDIKYIEKPQDLKNLRPEQIMNDSRSVDIKKIYIPSRTEIIKLREKIINKSIDRNSKFETTVQNNNTINNSIINRSEKTDIRPTITRAVYALPAYADGSGGPLKTDMIGKIHQNEVILNANQTKNLTGSQSGILKSSNSPNLKPDSGSGIPQGSAMKISPTGIKEIKKEEKENKEENSNIVPNENITLLRNASLADTPQLDKLSTSIEANLGSPLFLRESAKNKLLPVWRAALG